MIERIHRHVNDLGVAAYILMHGYNVIGKRDRSIYFECNNQDEVEEFNRLILDYQPPNDFYTFDSCLMFLKKIDIEIPENLDSNTHKNVTDLGVAAYLLMHEYKPNPLKLKIVGKKGRNVFFSHPPGVEEAFNRLSLNYLTSQFQNYDSSLMGLKKLPSM